MLPHFVQNNEEVITIKMSAATLRIYGACLYDLFHHIHNQELHSVSVDIIPDKETGVFIRAVEVLVDED